MKLWVLWVFILVFISGCQPTRSVSPLPSTASPSSSNSVASLPQPSHSPSPIILPSAPLSSSSMPVSSSSPINIQNNSPKPPVPSTTTALPSSGGSASNTSGSTTNEPNNVTATPVPVQWKRSLPSSFTVNEAAPLLHDGKLYLVSQSGSLQVLNAQTGLPLWQTSQPTAFETTPLLGPDGAIYLGGANGSFYALGPDGAIRWSFTPNEPNSFRLGGSALDENGVLYTGGTAETFYALNSVDGSELWRFQARAPLDNAPVVTSDRVYFLALDQTLYALDRATGTYIWEFQTGQPISDLSPALTSQEDIIFGSADPWLYSVNRHGLENWSYIMQAGLSASPVIGDDSTIYAPSADGTLYALDNDGQLIWKLNLGSRIQAAPVVGEDGTVYAGTVMGKLYGISITGDIDWTYQANGAIQGRLLLDDQGTLYAVTGEGQVLSFKTSSPGPANSAWPMESGNARAWGRL